MALIKQIDDKKIIYGVVYDDHRDKRVNKIIANLRLYETTNEQIGNYKKRESALSALQNKQNEYSAFKENYDSSENHSQNDIDTYNSLNNELQVLTKTYLESEFPGSYLNTLKIEVKSSFVKENLEKNGFNNLLTIYDWIKANSVLYGEWEDCQ